ncbi:MAG: helix-turn-helix domain-containing protein, partial [Planctomycetota bacterium]
CGGSAAQAARALGISEATIYRKLKAYRSAGADRL